jgi:hypothetical protein
VVLTVIVSDGLETASDTFLLVVDEHTTYLPIVVRNHISAPDLVVKGITATADDVQVVIENQGNAPTPREFWVDLYIDPDTVPTAVNQLWNHLGDQGIAWGVTLRLEPGQELTLSFDDEYYDPARSSVSWPLPAGTPIYAQVDSHDPATTYGALLEDHEQTGEPYNNIFGPVYVVGGTDARSFAPDHHGFSVFGD